jgi:hypothetical protein
MMLAEAGDIFAAVLAVAAPLVAVPLTVITFYLRSLREHQLTAQSQLERRVEACENLAAGLQRSLAERDRDFATKEEWLRETMYARRMLDDLREAVARLESRWTPARRTESDTPELLQREDRA